MIVVGVRTIFVKKIDICELQLNRFECTRFVTCKLSNFHFLYCKRHSLRLITLNIMLKKTRISKAKVYQVKDDTVLFKLTLKLRPLNHVPFSSIMEHCIIMHAWQRILNGFSLSVTFIFLSLYDIIMY